MHYHHFVVSSGQSLSEALNINGEEIVGLVMPNSWDSAGISFYEAGREAPDTYRALYDSVGSPLQVTNLSVGTRAQIPPGSLAGLYNVKLLSGAPGSAVAQTDTRTVTLVSRAYS